MLTRFCQRHAGRLMSPDEAFFVGYINRVYCQLAVEVEPGHLDRVLDKIKKSAAGLYIKTDGKEFIRNTIDYDTVTVHQIPKEVKTLSELCDWSWQEYTPAYNYALASVSADKNRIVLNSSHAISDGGFLFTLLGNLMNPSANHVFEHVTTQTGTLRGGFLKNQFDEFLKNRNELSHQWPQLTDHDLTYEKVQEIVHLPNLYDHRPPRLIKEIKPESLSIYDAKTGKMRGLSEFLWTGYCMAINVLNGHYGPIGLETCMDFRRLIPRDQVDNTFGNAFTNFALAVKNPRPQMTIGEICADFREMFNQIRKSGWFFKEYLTPLRFKRAGNCIAHLSNVGPVRIKAPIKDFYCQVHGYEHGLRPFIQCTTYSKIFNQKDLNTIIFHLRYSQNMLDNKMGRDLFEVFMHFLTHTTLDMKSGDVFDELMHFRESLN